MKFCGDMGRIAAIKFTNMILPYDMGRIAANEFTSVIRPYNYDLQFLL
jgi:hypothetical protein